MTKKFKFAIIVFMLCSIGLLTLVKIKRQDRIITLFLREDKPTCPKGVVTVMDGGRLCNKIFEYVSVWALSRSYGLVPYVPDSIHTALINVFTHLRIPPLSELNISWDSCLDLNNTTLNTTIYGISNLEKTLKNMNESEEPFVLRKYIVLVDSIVPLVGELKEEFKYQPLYINTAQDRLQRARAIMNDEHGNRETLFVAVHVRRADYLEYLKKRGVTVSVDASYYRHAVAWMLRKLTSDLKTSYNIAFILASDDKVWCEKDLIPQIKKEICSFGNQTKLGGSSVFYLGDEETPVVDLVMLSSCNHSIIAYGTYGLWSALMVNGWTVVYDIEAKNNPELVKLVNHSPVVFAKKLPKWIALS